MRSALLISPLFVLACAIILMSCGGSQPGTVNVSLSDPATCAAPSGPYRHIYVTVTDVKIHQSASASSNDSGWQDLAPQLKDSPVQVDLLGVANQCFLAMLGPDGHTTRPLSADPCDSRGKQRQREQQQVWKLRQLRNPYQRSHEYAPRIAALL